MTITYSRLCLLVAPVIHERPKVIKVEKKRTIVVECHVKAQAEPTFMWYKEQTVVQKSSRHTVNVKKITEGEFAVQLEISEAAQTDKGVYKLVAKNEKGVATSETVEVREIPEEKEEKTKKAGEKPTFAKGLEKTVRKIEK